MANGDSSYMGDFYSGGYDGTPDFGSTTVYDPGTGLSYDPSTGIYTGDTAPADVTGSGDTSMGQTDGGMLTPPGPSTNIGGGDYYGGLSGSQLDSILAQAPGGSADLAQQARDSAAAQGYDSFPFSGGAMPYPAPGLGGAAPSSSRGSSGATSPGSAGSGSATAPKPTVPSIFKPPVPLTPTKPTPGLVINIGGTHATVPTTGSRLPYTTSGVTTAGVGGGGVLGGLLNSQNALPVLLIAAAGILLLTKHKR